MPADKLVRVTKKTQGLLRRFKAKYGPSFGFIIEQALKAYIANEIKKLEQKG